MEDRQIVPINNQLELQGNEFFYILFVILNYFSYLKNEAFLSFVVVYMP